jgi:hypothetical protein
MSSCTWIEQDVDAREAMMSVPTLPKKPVENWEQVRDEWVEAVEKLITEAEGWARRREWTTKRDAKRVEEDRLGPYTVPRLLVHAVFGRFVLDPVCRFVPGAEGLVDFYVMPSWDSLTIVRDRGLWYLHLDHGDRVERRPWTEEVFAETVHRLSELQ